MKRRKYGDRRRRLAILEYRRTKSLQAAASAAGATRSWTYKFLKQSGEIGDRPVFTVRIAREAVKLYSTGLSCREVCEVLARSYNHVPTIQWVTVQVRQAGAIRSHSRATEIAEAKRRGRDFDRIRSVARTMFEEQLLSVLEISRRLGVATRTIERAITPALRCNRSEARGRRHWQAYMPDVERRRALRDDVVARRQGGATYDEIKAATGVTTHTIGYWLKQAGLTKTVRRRSRAKAAPEATPVRLPLDPNLCIHRLLPRLECRGLGQYSTCARAARAARNRGRDIQEVSL
jgi:transposase